MSQFTLDDLRRLLREAGGVAQDGQLDGDILDTAFTDLGYESLAVLELSALIQRERGLEIPDDDMAELKTPRQVIDYVNDPRPAAR